MTKRRGRGERLPQTSRRTERRTRRDPRSRRSGSLPALSRPLNSVPWGSSGYCLGSAMYTLPEAVAEEPPGDLPCLQDGAFLSFRMRLSSKHTSGLQGGRSAFLSRSRALVHNPLKDCSNTQSVGPNTKVLVYTDTNCGPFTPDQTH